MAHTGYLKLDLKQKEFLKNINSFKLDRYSQAQGLHKLQFP